MKQASERDIKYQVTKDYYFPGILKKTFVFKLTVSENWIPTEKEL